MLRFDKKIIEAIHSQFNDSNSSKNIKIKGEGVGGIFLVLKEFFLEGVWPPPP